MYKYTYVMKYKYTSTQPMTTLQATYEQSSRMVEPSLELAACKPMSVLMVRALCRELVKCMGTARDGGLGVAAPPGHVTANTCVTVITV